MFQNIKKFLVIFGVSIFLFSVIAPLSGVFSKHLKYRKPYASTLTLPSPIKDVTEEDEETDDEETDGEDCGEECGEECSADEWDCGDWNACTDGKQSRECSMSFDCEDANTPSPATSQRCEVKEATPPPPPPEPTCKEDKWECGSWSVCTDSKQSRRCKIVDDCEEADTPSPATSQKCEVKEMTPTPEPEPKQPEPTPPPPPTRETDDKAKEAARLEAERKEAERKAAEEAKRLEEEKKEAARKAAEELKIKEEEEAKRLEEERKKAEEEALQREQERIVRAAQEAERAQEQLKQVVVETPAFKEIFVTPPVVTVPAVDLDALKRAAGINPKKADVELIKKEVEIAVIKRKELVKEKGEAEAEKEVQHAITKVREERKREIIQKASRKTIASAKQGVRERGVSDEVAVLYGFQPDAQLTKKETETFSSPVEKKLFGVPSTKTIDQVKKPTLGLTHGSKIGERGAALLATCPTKNAVFELHAIDAKGVDRSVAKQTCSENNKLVLSVPALPSGNYAFKVKPISPSPISWFFPSFASTLNADTPAGVSEESDPVLVSVVSDPGVPQPIVESIEGVNIAGLRDIQISAGTDGKVTVSGSSDITTMVIGTFSSAVFTSAMLADIDTGRFEVVSPRALEAGTHEVVIYATRPEESAQSVPVKLRFNLIGVAKAEAPAEIEVVSPGELPVISHPSAPEKKFPLVPVLAFGGLAVLLIGIGIFLKKNKKSAS